MKMIISKNTYISASRGREWGWWGIYCQYPNWRESKWFLRKYSSGEASYYRGVGPISAI